MIDLNTLVLPGSGLTVRDADFVNRQGEIAGRGVLPNGDVHAILLVPCDDDRADTEGCKDDIEGASGLTQGSPESRNGPHSETPAPLRSRPSSGYRIPERGIWPLN